MPLPTAEPATAAGQRTAVEKALDVMLAFGDRGHTGIGVSELARRAELSKSTAFRLLGMLEGRGVVERAGAQYRLGARLHELGEQVYPPAQNDVREVLTPFLAQLFVLTQETVHLAVLHGTDVLYLNKLAGPSAVPTPSHIGGRAPAYCTAAGKALLAFNPVAAEAALRAHRPAWTPRSLVDGSDLSRELEAIRHASVAYDNEEWRTGLSCVAVPVFGVGRRTVAALSMSGPTGRIGSLAHSAALRRLGHAGGLAMARHTRGPAPSVSAVA